MRSYFVYLYRDPSRSNERIYVGKGTGRRHLRHLARTDHCEFVHRLQKMRREGTSPVIEFLTDGVDEDLALLVEVEAISLYGRKTAVMEYRASHQKLRHAASKL
jgi:hypothetical protein